MSLGLTAEHHLPVVLCGVEREDYAARLLGEHRPQQDSIPCGRQTTHTLDLRTMTVTRFLIRPAKVKGYANGF